MHPVTYPFINGRRWNEIPAISIDTLSGTQQNITIHLPKGTYLLGSYTQSQLIDKEVDAVFSIKETITGTPTAVLSRLRSNRLSKGELYKYVEGNNTWLISREVCILNNQVSFILMPTDPMTTLVGLNLMECSSRMSKLIKEKVIPDIVMCFGSNFIAKIIDTSKFIVNIARSPRSIIDDNKVKDILLDNVDIIL